MHCVPARRAATLAELFGGETGDEVDKFARCAWHEGPEGVPMLDGCANRFVGPGAVARATPATTTPSCSSRSPPRRDASRARVHVPPREADRAGARGLMERFTRLLPDRAEG